jgi:hypothetical protein
MMENVHTKNPFMLLFKFKIGEGNRSCRESFHSYFMFKEGKKSSCEEFVHAFYVQGKKPFMPRIISLFILNSRRETVHLGNPFMLF